MKWLNAAATLLISGAVLLANFGSGDELGRASAAGIDPMPGSGVHIHPHGSLETEEEQGMLASWTWTEGTPSAERPAELVIRLKDRSGKPIDDLQTNHEKLMHLIAVSEDLEQFQHLHPEYEGEGVFRIALSFPTGGKYKLYADFLPAGHRELTRTAEVEVDGGAEETAAELSPSHSLSESMNGVVITLSAGHLMAGMPSTLTYTFRDKKSGHPVRDLEPYLGAVGHVIAIGEGAGTYLHVHPMNAETAGPQAVFSATFPKSGMYKIWGQFQRGGELMTVPFVLRIP